MNKNDSVLALVILFISFFSYGNTNEYSIEKQGFVTTALDDSSSVDCFSTNYSVYSQGVLFWRAAWFRYYGLDSSDMAKNQREFSYTNIVALQNSHQNIQGYRLYYGMPSTTDSIPLLIMAAVGSNCEDMTAQDPNRSVLVSDGTNQFFCSLDSAGYYTKLWRDYSLANNELIKSLVYAYNYEAATINGLLQNGTQTGGLMFELGLRTLSPQETDFNVIDQNIYGSIIYCNLVYGTAFDPTKGKSRYDFAKPCPQICDFTSPLATDL